MKAKSTLLIFSFFFFSSIIIGRELPEIFNQSNDSLSLYTLKQYYLNQELSAEKTDSLIQQHSDLLKRRNQFAYFLNEITRVNLYNYFGNFKAALTQMEVLRNVSFITSNDKLSGYYHTSVGSVYFSLSKWEKSREHYRTALNLLTSVKDSIGIKGSLVNIGNTYNLMADYDSAMFFYNKALALEALGIEEFHYNLMNNIANVKKGLRDTQGAIEIYEKMIYDERGNLNPYVFSATAFNLSNLYGAGGEFVKVITIVNEAIKVAEKSDQNAILPLLYRNLSEAHKNLGNSNEAFASLQIADSLEKIESARELEEYASTLILNHQVEINQKEQEKQTQIINAEVKRKNQLKIFLCIAISLLLLIFYLYFKKRQKNKILFKQNLALARRAENPIEKKKISEQNNTVSEELKEKIEKIFHEKEIFKDPELSLEKLAKKLDSNRSYVSEAFSELYAMPFRSLINQLRIEEARRLLIDENFKHYSIEGIALTVGYRNISSFNSAFKKETGITPSYFRNKHITN